MQETPDDELQRLRKEQRERLHEDMRRLSESIIALGHKIELLAPRSELAELEAELVLQEKRLAKLESDKGKIIGGFIALTALPSMVGFLLWILSKPH